MIAPSGCTQPDEEEAVELGVDDAAVERDAVVGRVQELVVEEREGDLVARAVDDQVELLGGAVHELDGAPAGKARDVRLDLDVAVAQPGKEVGRDGGVGLRELVVGLRAGRSPSARRRPSSRVRPRRKRWTASGRRLRERPAPARRWAWTPTYFGTIQAPRRIARKVAVRVPRSLDGQVGGRVADPEHHDPLAAHHVGLLVGVDVDLLALERVLPLECRLGPARVPVVAVRDDHGACRSSMPSSPVSRSRQETAQPPSLGSTWVTSVRKRMRSRNPKWST